MEQSALEWLIEEITFDNCDGQIWNKYNDTKDLSNIIEQAKEIEREQDKNKYSEEEVMTLLNNLRLDTFSNSMGRVEFLEWFEEFKKK